MMSVKTNIFLHWMVVGLAIALCKQYTPNSQGYKT